MDRDDFLDLVLAQRVVGVRVGAHGSGPVEGQHGGDVFEVVRLHQLEQGPHGAAVELEDAQRVSPGQQLVGRRVIQLQGFEVEVDAAVHFDVFQGIGNDRQVSQPEEVHLDQAEAFGRRIVELGDDLAVLEAAHDRNHVDDGVRGHDDAGGVHAPLPLQALDAQRRLEDLGSLRVGADQLAEVAGLAVALGLGVLNVGQRNVLGHHGRRQRLGQLLAHAERVAQHARRVLEGLLGLDGAVGDDHRHAFVAVFARDVVDHFGAAPVIEVDVEVRHGDAVRVEEALEDQAVVQRVKVGDAHGVRHHGAGTGATPGTDPDAVVLGPVDEVGHHEEVAREAHGGDDFQLIVGLLADLVRDALGIAVAGVPCRLP